DGGGQPAELLQLRVATDHDRAEPGPGDQHAGQATHRAQPTGTGNRRRARSGSPPGAPAEIRPPAGTPGTYGSTAPPPVPRARPARRPGPSPGRPRALSAQPRPPGPAG